MNIELDSGEIVKCYTYELKDFRMPEETEEEIAYGILPSLTYVKVIVKGAIESKLPKGYVSFLRTIKHNGNKKFEMEDHLQLADFEL